MIAAAPGSIATCWAAWIGALEAKNVAARMLLRPGANDAALVELEAVIGARLPSEARELYALADGQLDVFTIEAPAAGKILTPIFGAFEFNSLERVAAEWSSWREIRNRSTEEELDDFDLHVDVRAGDPVRKRYQHALWIPFATDGGGNSLALDLDPAPGGTRGQIIVIGSDEDERRVLAGSLSAFLAESARLLEVGRLTIGAPDDDDAPVAFFDIEPARLQ